MEQFRRLEALGERAVQLWDKPDAGLWELRTRESVHTFSSMMCWAACDRLARIADRFGLDDRTGILVCPCGTTFVRGSSGRHGTTKLKSITGSFAGQDVDASLLADAGGWLSLQPEDPKFQGTLALIEKRLRKGMHLFRYGNKDDFGIPENAFNVCTFWYIEALAMVGRRDEARDLFDHMLSCRNPVGLACRKMWIRAATNYGAIFPRLTPWWV